MTPDSLSAMWADIAPALGNHMWQSTLFAALAGLLTLVLRKNQARARHWLWLAASIKFLVPFSLLVGLGNQMPWPHTPGSSNAGLYVVMEQVSQPFTPANLPVSARVVISTPASTTVIHPLPFLFLAWLCGFLTVLVVWCLRWRRIKATAREAAPLRAGREVEALHRLQRRGVRQTPLEIRLSPASLEPGIFGIARPVLIWPEGVSERLAEPQLEAILAHEMWHVRRRDNLAGAMHMLVEAIFWFHPLVWWLGARLVEERERACDEGVLQLGNPPKVYAQSILNVCEFCVGSPLPCVSGVTGSDLKKRVVRIMTDRVVGKLDFGKKLLLSAAGLMAIGAPVVFGLLHATQGRAQSQSESKADTAYVYEVASIKPNKSADNMVRLMITPDGLSATGATLQMLIETAYDIQDNQLSGAPGWLRSDKYDIEAKMDSAVADQLRKLDPDQHRAARQRMLQALLADRFKLTIHRESTEQPVYALVIAKSGSKLHEAKPGDTYPNGLKGPNGQPGKGLMMMGGNGGPLTGQGIAISNLVRALSRQLGRKVIDKTGLNGIYDFTLKWAPDQSTAMFSGPGGGPSPADSAPSDSSGPSIFTAVQEQLGLKLESQKGPVEVIVIDHVEKPSEN